MNCVMEGENVKVFGKAVHSLAWIGDELWLDPSTKGLALRAVNSARSAYTCFLFSPMFFHQYSPGSTEEQGTEAVKCKLDMKSIIPLFRYATTVEHNVERCQIFVNSLNDQVVFEFSCKFGVIKTHKVHFQESEALQVVFASHLCPNVLKAPARLLSDMLKYFPLNQEEITLSMTPLKVTLKNHYDDGTKLVQHSIPTEQKTMNTEMALHPNEFDFFQIKVNSEITFSLKELRGLLFFTESHSLKLSVSADGPGMPVCFSVEDIVLEASVVLATLTDSETGARSQLNETTDPPELRCADITVPESVDVSLDVNTVKEVIPSSQGSPTDIPSQLEHHLLHPSFTDICTPTEKRINICPLLYKALSADHDDDLSAELPVLACQSDEETQEEN